MRHAVTPMQHEASGTALMIGGTTLPEFPPLLLGLWV
jgi:hypothetical protein